MSYEDQLQHMLEMSEQFGMLAESKSYRGSVRAGLEALRACEKIRELCVEEREAGYCHADLDTLEELLP